MPNRILIVDDEQKIARFLELELKYEGYEVDVENNGRDGLQAIENNAYDLVILDVMMPGLNGMEVLRRVRHNSDVPVIMLTAKSETMDKVMGLDFGADDYLTKPFEIEELLARIRNAFRRRGQNYSDSAKHAILELNGLKMDLSKHEVSYEGTSVELTKKEYDLLELLLRNADVVLNREKILNDVWGYDFVGDTNVVDVYIRYLRSKIDDQFNVKIIHTVRGVGYVIKNEAH